MQWHIKHRRRKQLLRLDCKLRLAAHFATDSTKRTRLMMALLTVTHILSMQKCGSAEGRMFFQAKHDYKENLLRPTSEQLSVLETILAAEWKIKPEEHLLERSRMLRRARNL